MTKRHKVLLKWIGRVVARLYKNLPGVGSQRELATLLLCSRQKVSNICRGVEQGLTVVELYDICNILQIDPLCILPSQRDLDTGERILSEEVGNEHLDSLINHRISTMNERSFSSDKEECWIYYSNLLNGESEDEIMRGKIQIRLSNMQIPTIELHSCPVGICGAKETSEAQDDIYIGSLLNVTNAAVQCWELFSAQEKERDRILLFLPKNRRHTSSTIGHMLRISNSAGVSLMQKCIICQDCGSDIATQDEIAEIAFKLLLKTKAMRDNYILFSEI